MIKNSVVNNIGLPLAAILIGLEQLLQLRNATCGGGAVFVLRFRNISSLHLLINTRCKRK